MHVAVLCQKGMHALTCINALPSLPSSLQPLTNVQMGPTIVLSSALMKEEAFAAAAMLGSSWVQMESAVQVSSQEGKDRKEKTVRNRCISILQTQEYSAAKFCTRISIYFYEHTIILTSLQTSMSVALTMVVVLTTVPTPRALSHAAAEVDSS